MTSSRPRLKDLLCKPEQYLAKLPLPVPPMLEETLGYAGAARFVGFYQSYLRRVGPPGCVIVDDSHVVMPGNSNGWRALLEHPAFALLLDRVHLSLSSQPYIDEERLSDAITKEAQGDFFRNTRALVLDRVDRVLYGGRVDNARVFIMLTACDAPCSSDEDDPETLENQGDEQDTDGTSEQVDPMIEDDDGFRQATPEQIASLRRWLDESLCTTPDARWLLGRVYLDQQDFASAIECFEAAVALDREVLREDAALDEMVEAYFFSEKFGEAACLLEEQIQDCPDDLNSYSKLMHVYARDNRPVEAREIADRAAHVLPNDPLAHLLVAEAAFIQLNYDEMIESAGKAIAAGLQDDALQSNHPAHLFAMALWHWKRNHFEDALHLVCRIEETDDTEFIRSDRQFLIVRMHCCLRVGHFDQAVQAAESLATAYPDCQELLGIAYLSARRYDEAIRILEPLAQDCTKLYARRALAQSFVSSDRVEEALRVYTGRPETNSDADMCAELARLLFELGQTQAGAAYLGRAKALGVSEEALSSALDAFTGIEHVASTMN